MSLVSRQLVTNLNFVWLLGKDIHFCILSNADEIIKMCPKINQTSNLNGLKHLQDSVLLLGVLIQLKKMDRVIPHMMTYNDPKAAEAKKPKIVQKLPPEHMAVTPHGFYIFTMESSGYKTYLWLGFMVFLAFFFLLFRVWPEWLRLAVWYISWYILVFLVSLHIFELTIFFIVRYGDYSCDRLVRNLPFRNRLLDIPQLLHWFCKLPICSYYITFRTIFSTRSYQSFQLKGERICLMWECSFLDLEVQQRSSMVQVNSWRIPKI